MAAPGAEADVARASADLRVLNAGPRLALLRLLARPMPVVELSRTTGVPETEVASHVGALVAAGFARKAPAVVGAPELFSAVPGRIFALAESLHALATPPDESELLQTQAALKASRGSSALLKLGPALAIVHGVRPGAVFPISGAGPWTLGRDAACTIVLDDALASSRHARVEARAGKHVLVDDGSRNGTFLNWERLPPRGEAPLVSGDIIGAGKTLVAYRRPG